MKYTKLAGKDTRMMVLRVDDVEVVRWMPSEGFPELAQHFGVKYEVDYELVRLSGSSSWFSDGDCHLTICFSEHLGFGAQQNSILKAQRQRSRLVGA